MDRNMDTRHTDRYADFEWEESYRNRPAGPLRCDDCDADDFTLMPLPSCRVSREDGLKFAAHLRRVGAWLAVICVALFLVLVLVLGLVKGVAV